MSQSLLGEHSGDWRQRLDYIVETMRALSLQTDPQEMVRVYGERMGTVGTDGWHGLAQPP